jgi:signal transduction histidine kinase
MNESSSTWGKILVVDDEPVNVRLLERILLGVGYRDVITTTDARQVLDLYRSHQPDLVLLDLMMPYLDGAAVLGQLRAETGDTVYLPIVVLTADGALEARQRALTAGATDFLTKPFEQLEMILRIRNLLDTRRLYLTIEAHNRSLEQTVRERTERLVQSEKIATMGSLLAGVAHELNNPLAILSGQAQLLRETVEPQQIARRSDKIYEAADRCVRIVRNFLALARQRPPERADMRLNQVVRGAVELLAYELRTDGIDVVLDLADDVPVLWADSHQLHQVVVNLVANAHQAMRGNRGARTGPRTIALTTRHDAEGARVRLEVTDTGPGIPPEVRAKIFEPFFTTKPPGEGTGLGLSLCRGIVEEHGGTLAVESEPGHGARFVIELPVLARPGADRHAETTEGLPPIGPKTILIVDDEPDVAAMLAEALALDGHRTEIATNGAIALERLDRQPYDLVVSDTKMPVLSGEELYAQLQRRFPALRQRIIFLTGDLLSREKREFLERTGVPFLAKPCDLGQVRQLVHRTLALPPGGRATAPAPR